MPRHDPPTSEPPKVQVTISFEDGLFANADDNTPPLCAGRRQPQLLTWMPPHLLGHQDQIIGELLESGGVANVEFGKVLMLRPTCSSCTTCLPTRIDLEAYAPSSRMLRLADDLAKQSTITIQDLTDKRAHAAHGYLWATYVLARGPQHFYGDFKDALALDSYPPVKNHPEAPDMTLSFRNAAGTLIGGMELIPALQLNATSKGQTAKPVVYGARNYYQTDGSHPSTSPGIAQIALACTWLKAQGYAYFYLGPTTTDPGPFAYKTRFKPEVRLPNGAWVPFKTIQP